MQCTDKIRFKPLKRNQYSRLFGKASRYISKDSSYASYSTASADQSDSDDETYVDAENRQTSLQHPSVDELLAHLTHSPATLPARRHSLDTTGFSHWSTLGADTRNEMTNSIELPVNNYGLYTVTKKLHDNRQHSEHTADIGNKIPHKHIDSFFVADCAFDGESKPLQAQSSPSRRRMPLKRDRTHTTICDRRWLRTKDRNKAIENNSTHTLQNSPKALPTRALQKSPRRTTVNRSPTFLPGDPKRVASILARVNRKNELHGLPATNIAQVPDNLQNSYLSRMPHVPRIGNDSISRYKRNTAKKNNNIKAFQAQLSPKQHLLESGDSSIASIKDKNANTAFAYKSSLADRETSANSNLNKKSALPRVLEQIESLLSRNRSSAHRHKKSLSSDNSSSTAHSNVENNTSTVSNEAVVNHNNIHINSLQSRLVAVQQQLTQQNEEYNSRLLLFKNKLQHWQARCQILEKHYDQEQEAWHKRMEYQDQQHSQELELLNRKHQKEIFQLAEQIKKLSHDNQVFRQSSSSVDNILTSQTSINYYTHNESSDCVDHQFFKDQITMIQSESISFDIETSKLFNNMQKTMSKLLNSIEDAKLSRRRASINI